MGFNELVMSFVSPSTDRACLAGILCGTAFMVMQSISAGAGEAPANSLRELFARLDQCLYTDSAGRAGSEVAIQFSLKRSGELLGKPRIAFAKFRGDWFEQHRFVESLTVAIDRCFPISITDALGGAIAGRQLYLRFIVRARELDTLTGKSYWQGGLLFLLAPPQKLS